jgi:predicted ABC-type ATPase
MVAGPNGAGKTTLTNLLRGKGVILGEYINPDDIAAALSGTDEERATEARLVADRRREACLERKADFAFETVMSHESKIDFLKTAITAGFSVELFFVGIDDPRTAVERVRLRVDQGGHNVSESKIIDRWNRTMRLLHQAIRVADKSFVFDNSAPGNVQGPVLVFDALRRGDGQIVPNLRIRPPSVWLREYVLIPLECDAF